MSRRLLAQGSVLLFAGIALGALYLGGGANLMIGEQGQVYVMDWGLALEIERPLTVNRPADPPRGRRNLRMTMMGQVVGSPAYMPPEQARGELDQLGPHSDIYALGATLYEVLTFGIVFTGARTLALLIEQICEAPPEPPSQRAPQLGIPSLLDAIVLKCLAKQPKQRYATAGEIAADIDAFLEGQRVSAADYSLVELSRLLLYRHRRSLLLAAVVVGLLGLTFGGIRAYERFSLRRQVAALLDEGDRHRLAARSGDTAQQIRAWRAAETAYRGLLQLDGGHHVARQRLLEAVKAQLAAQERLAREERREVAARHIERARELSPLYWLEPGQARWAEIELELNQAQQSDPDWDEPIRLLASLFHLRWQKAIQTGDEQTAALAERRLRLLDPQQRHTSPLLRRGEISLTCDATGARAYLFRFISEDQRIKGGEVRLAPSPVDRTGKPCGDPRRGRPAFTLPDAPDLDVKQWPGLRAEYGKIGKLVRDGRPGEAGRALERFVQQMALQDLGPLLELYREALFNLACLRARAGRLEQSRAALLRLSELGWPRLGRVATDPDLSPLGDWRSKLARRQRSAFYRLSPTAANLLGSLPVQRQELPAGSYLVLVRAPAFRDTLLPVLLRAHGSVEQHVEPFREGLAPAGLLQVPAGESYLGSRQEEFGAGPWRAITVDGFWIGRFEVTCQEYAAFLATPGAAKRAPRSGSRLLWSRGRDGVWRPPAGWHSHPVAGVSWLDAAAYADHLSEQSKLRARERGASGWWRYRLPRRVEWERAARGADGRRYPWGDHFDWRFARLGRSRAGQAALEPVASFLRDQSVFGCYDMAGSVREWCLDLYDSRTIGDRGLFRVIKGGAWNDLSTHGASLAVTTGAPPSLRHPAIGFRLAADYVSFRR